MSHPLDAYFDPQVGSDQLVSVDASSCGAVTRPATMVHGEAVPGGLFDPSIFGPLDGSLPRWGHLDVGGVMLAGTSITKVPIPPIASRRPIALEDPAARSRWHGPINEAWAALIQASARRVKLVEAGAPAGILAREAEHVQHHFEDVLALHRGEQPEPHHPHPPVDGLVWLMWPCAPRGEELRALLFLDEDRLLVQSRAGCRVIDRSGKLAGPSFKPTGPLASSVRGDLVLFNAGQRDRWSLECYDDDGAWPDEAEHRAPLAAYDLVARRWLDVVDDRLPAWIVDETDVEGADAFELRTAAVRSLTSPRTSGTQFAQTRDGRFAYVAVYDDNVFSHDAIVEIATQRTFVEPSEALDAPIVSLGPTAASAPALNYDASLGWRVVDRYGNVGDGERWWYRLEGAAHVAWSPTGAQLAAIVGNELVIVDITPAGATIGSRAQIG